MNHSGHGGDGGQSWKKSRDQRRQKLRANFQESRRYNRRHQPPPDPDDWEPDPMWKHIWTTLWDNPVLLMMVAIVIAIIVYFIFPPSWMFF